MGRKGIAYGAFAVAAFMSLGIALNLGDGHGASSKALVNTDVLAAAGKASVQAAEVLADAGEVAAEAVLEVLAGVFGGF